ncbi:MAG: hypothetical protein U0441_34260 [Polyangiaceae bacterium]
MRAWIRAVYTSALLFVSACGSRSALLSADGAGGDTTGTGGASTGAGGSSTGTGGETTSSTTTPTTTHPPTQIMACGSLTWAASFGGGGEQRIFDVAPDPAGGAYVLGTFHSQLDCGQGNVFMPGLGLFLSHVNAAGEIGWCDMWPNLDPMMVDFNLSSNVWAGRGSHLLTVDGEGNAVVAANFSDTANFGDGPEPKGARVLSVDAGGKLVRKVLIPVSEGGMVIPMALASTKGDHLLLAADFGGSVAWGAIDLPSEPQFDAFFAELDSTGNGLWARRILGPGTTVHERIDPAPDGTAVLYSLVEYQADFGDGPYQSICLQTENGQCTLYGTDRVAHRFGPGGDVVPVLEDAPGLGHENMCCSDVPDARLLPDGSEILAKLRYGPPSLTLSRQLRDAAGQWSPLWEQHCSGTFAGTLASVAGGDGSQLFLVELQGSDAPTPECLGVPTEVGEWLFQTDIDGNYQCHLHFGGAPGTPLVARDAAGGILIGGTYQDALTTESGKIPISGKSDAVVLRYGPK